MRRTIELQPLELLQGDPENPKDHSIDELAKSVERFGYVDAVIIDERTGRLVSGHGRVDTLRLMKKDGKPAPEGVEVDSTGSWLVPVQRGWASKSDTDARAFVVAANELVTAGGWESSKLDAYLLQIARDGEEALKGTGFDSSDVDRILREINGTPDDEPGEEPRAEIFVKPGDVWALGEHRLACGDSLLPQDLARLLDGAQVDAVVADPPYAIFGSSTGIGADIADDKMVRPFFEAVGKSCLANVKTFGHVYLCTDWRSWPAMWEGMKRAGLGVKNCIVWDKGGGGVGSMWAQCYELVGFFVVEPSGKALRANTERGQRQVFKPNILRHSRASGDDRPHNASKPVKLIEEFVDAAADRGGSVLDLFLGGGSTLIACEQTGRKFYGQDLEPKWVQSSMQRWEKLTGKKAQRVKSDEAPGKAET